MNYRHMLMSAMLTLLMVNVGCSKSEANSTDQAAAHSAVNHEAAPGATTAPAAKKDCTADDSCPAFTLAWSEYPSWPVFQVAHERGFLNGEEGKYGSLEKQYQVDVVLKSMGYEASMIAYGSGAVDATCITNIDSLGKSLTVKSVAIMPTSTSDGGDALVVSNDIKTIEDLKGISVYGLKGTVSSYAFWKKIDKAGLNRADFKFVNMEPPAAALLMQQKQKGVKAVMVWNPYINQTLKIRPDTHVLFSSTSLKREIIDMVVASQKSLDRPGGDRFAKCIIAAFYAVCKKLDDPSKRSQVLIDIGKRFSSLNVPEMEKVLKLTVFYKDADVAVKLFTDKTWHKTMNGVVDFWVNNKNIPHRPSVGYGSKTEAPKAQFRIDPSYMQAVQNESVH